NGSNGGPLDFCGGFAGIVSIGNRLRFADQVGSLFNSGVQLVSGHSVGFQLLDLGILLRQRLVCLSLCGCCVCRRLGQLVFERCNNLGGLLAHLNSHVVKRDLFHVCHLQASCVVVLTVLAASVANLCLVPRARCADQGDVVVADIRLDRVVVLSVGGLAGLPLDVSGVAHRQLLLAVLIIFNGLAIHHHQRHADELLVAHHL